LFSPKETELDSTTASTVKEKWARVKLSLAWYFALILDLHTSELTSHNISSSQPLS